MLDDLILYCFGIEGRIPATGDASQSPYSQQERVVVDVVVGHDVDLVALFEPL